MDGEEKQMNLEKIGVGKSARVADVKAEESMLKRYYDIGLLPGTKIDCVMQKGKNGMRAYRIRGAVIAIRLNDIRGITVFAEGCV